MPLPILALLLGPVAVAGTPGFQLVESAPIETTLDHPDIPDAADVWLEMIKGAKTSLDIAEFYVSNEKGSRLEPILAAMEDAAARGVAVHIIADAKYAKTYPDDLARLAKSKGVEVRRIDFSQLTGGVHHAKYFLVDGREAYVGSQNMDWRSLDHIQELGVRVAVPALVAVVQDVFDTDWALAGGASHDTRVHHATAHFPVIVGEGPDALTITPAVSPTGWIPDESLYDLPQIVSLLDSAHSTIRVQLLNYKTFDRGVPFSTLDDALRRAAARGVAVQLMVSDWSMRAGTIEGLQTLEALPNIDVKLVTIPPVKSGFIPFARTIHAKYAVVDGARAWIGTSNWAGDFFTALRGVGFVVDGASFAGELDRFFLGDWNSPYAAEVEPGKVYTAPIISE